MLSAIVLIALGAAVTTLTGRSPLRSAIRQLLFGLGAAAITMRSDELWALLSGSRAGLPGREGRVPYGSGSAGAADDDHRTVCVSGAMLADRSQQQACESAVSA